MATLSNSQRLKEARRKREEENKNSSSQSDSRSYRNSEKLEKKTLERSIGMDTFESDVSNLGTTISNIYNEWQTPETMRNTRSSVEAMQKRINDYQTYQSKYGGADLSDLANGYQSVLDDWDNLAAVYGNYQNADAFNTAKKKAQMDSTFSGLSYDDVQSKLKEYDEDSDEYKYLSEYTGYSDLKDFDKALENATRMSDDEIKEAKKRQTGYERYIGAKVNDDSYYKKLETKRNQYALDNTFDLYKDLMDAEDFEEKSQYVSTKSDGKLNQMTSKYGLGYDDLTYEYINDVDGMRNKIDSKATAYGRDSSDGISSMEKKGYDKLNEDEIAVYNYIYSQDKEKAQKFLDDMEVTLTKRVYDENTQRWEDAADSGAVASTLMSALSVPANFVGSITGTAEAVGDALQGKEYNPYGYYKNPSNYASDVRKYVGENIEEETEGMELFGQNIPSFLYQTGMSMADSGAGALAFGEALSPLMGMSAFQQKAKELKEAGASDEEIATGAIASGAFEMIFEKFSLDNLIKTKNADSIGKIVKETLKQAGIEGSEEIATEVSNILFDTISRGKSSDAYKKYEEYLESGFSEEEAREKVAMDLGGQIAWAGIGGALSGLGMGGASSSLNYVENRNTGNMIRDNYRAEDMMEMAAMTPQESETFNLYTEYANNGINSENISNAQLGNLYSTAVTENQKTLSNGRKLSDGELASAVSDNEKLNNISNYNEESARRKRADSLDKGEVTEVTSTGNSAKIEGFRKDGDDTIVLTNEGEVKTDDMTFSETDAELISYAEAMGEEKGNLFISQYDGKTDVADYVKSFNMAYTYGEHGFASETVISNKGVLTESQASEIYKNAMISTRNAQQNAIDDLNTKYGKNMTIEGTFDDSIVDYESGTVDDSKINWSTLTSTQRNAINFAKVFSKATGVNITLIKSNVVDGKHKGKNGSYNPDTNTIEIDVYAGRIDAAAINDAIIPTISHEVTHWMKAKSPAMYSKMRESVSDVLTADGKHSMDELIDMEMTRMENTHPDQKVTSDMAVDELIARTCEDMLSNSEKTRELLNCLTESEKSTFINKVKETFKNLIDWVNDLLGKYKSNSEEAKVLRQYETKLKELSNLWDQALEEAVQTNQSLQKEGITGEQAINDVTEKVGIVVDMENESASPSEQFSERTWTESEYVQNRDKAVTKLSEALGISKDKAVEYIDSINSVARMIANDRVRLDYEANIDENATVVKPNSEYKWSVDMSTLCAKRLYFTGTFDEVQKQLPNTAMDSDDIVRLRSMMMERGYEVACGICYVKSTRREIGTITADFIERYKLAQKKGTPITRLNSEGKEVELQEKGMKTKFYAEEGYTPTLADLNTTDIDLVKRDHPTVYASYLSYMNARGQAKPKLLETRAEYKGEILSHFKAKSAVKSRNDAGGLRLQSFSDFEVPHLIDMMQVTMDMSRVGLKSQAYTKVVNFAEAFGDTGIKINLSLIAKGDGIDEDGNLIFDDVEGINHEEAFRLRDKYSKNVGTILVGKNDAHIIKAMSDPRIDYIIPFHKSSWKESLYDALGLTGYDDYTEYQNEKPIDKNRKIKNFDPSEYWDFSKSGDENAQIYLEKCKEDGRVPKFPQFQGYEGYWKLLIDFKMYDNDGVGSPQNVVTPNFNMDECNRILNEYKGGHRSFPVAKDVVNDFVSEYKKNHPQEQYSDREIIPISEEKYDEMKKHFGTTNNFRVAGYLLKDGKMLDFSGKHWGDTTSRMRQVDHRDVNEVLEDNDNYDAMVQMIANGNIRLMPETGGICLSQPPTEKQRLILREYIKMYSQYYNDSDGVIVDFDKAGGDTVYSKSYRKGTDTRTILIDIDNYFRGGTQSELMQFHTQYSDRDYSYDALISKPDMHITKVQNVGNIDRKTVIEKAIFNARENGFTNKNGNAVIHVSDIDRDIIVPKHSIIHGMDRRFLNQAPVFVRIGEVLKNAIRINELNPRSENVNESYALIGVASDGTSFYTVSFVVNSYTGEIDKIDVLYSTNTKKEPAALLPTVTDKKSATPTDSKISIANLLELVNSHFADLLPEDILRHFGHERRPKGTLGENVLFSDRDTMTRSEAQKLSREKVSSYKEQIEKKAKIESITQKALTLNKWMLKNSKDEHIPEAMKPVVTHLLKAIDFSSKQLLGMRGGQYNGMPTKADISLSQALADVQQMMSSASVDEEVLYELYGADLDADMADLVKSVNLYMRTVGDNEYVLNQMTLDDLHKLDKIVGAIKSSVTKMNQFHVVNTKKSIAHIAQEGMTYMDSLGQAKLHKSKMLSGASHMLNWGNATPYYAFKRFGEGGVKVYEALQDGWDKFAFHIKKIIDYAESTYTNDEVKKWSEELKSFDILLPATKEEMRNPNFNGNYQKIQMTIPQIMSLYCLQKREQAKGHIAGGGIRITDIETKKGVISQSEGTVLTEKELNRIIGTLTPRQIEVADALQKFMNEDCTVWGNEISMKRFGYKAFGEENYFPIRSDENVTGSDDVKEQEKTLYRLLNMSFTKSLTQNANNRIVVDNIFDVFAQHTSEMAKYNALALPVLDAVRWFNYKEKGEKVDGHFKTYGIKQSIEKAFGKDAKNYVNTFLQDINGADNVGRDKVAKGFMSNAKIASVGFNAKVMALQPTSYLRASAVIDNKYLVQAFSRKPKIEMAEKWCGMAQWKALGFIDINVQRGVADLIKHEENFKDKATDWSMKGAEIADKVTLGYLWNACEAEVKANRNDLKVGSDEYYTAVGKRLRDVIYATQVVDSTMTRSHMMRSADTMDKLLTNFASEPTLSYNMLMDVYYDFKLTERQTGSKSRAFNKHGKKLARTLYAYTITNAVTALLELGFEVFRDDEDEEKDHDELMKLYLENLALNQSIVNKIPYAKEAVSILQGFSSSRIDTQWMQYFSYTIKGIAKLMEGEGNAYTTAKNGIKAISYLSGIPFFNLWRDANSLLDKTDVLTAEELEEMYNDTIGNVFPSLKSK